MTSTVPARLLIVTVPVSESIDCSSSVRLPQKSIVELAVSVIVDPWSAPEALPEPPDDVPLDPLPPLELICTAFEPWPARVVWM